MRQCEFKKRYDPEMDMHVGKHIYGEGITDIFKSVGRKLFGKTAKSMAKKAAKTAATTAATKTGEYAGKKAGDKIVKLLTSQNKIKEPSTPSAPSMKTSPDPLTINQTAQNVNDRIRQLLAGGKLRRRNII